MLSHAFNFSYNDFDFHFIKPSIFFRDLYLLITFFCFLYCFFYYSLYFFILNITKLTNCISFLRNINIITILFICKRIFYCYCLIFCCNWIKLWIILFINITFSPRSIIIIKCYLTYFLFKLWYIF